jgi:hypothetical protein
MYILQVLCDRNLDKNLWYSPRGAVSVLQKILEPVRCGSISIAKFSSPKVVIAALAPTQSEDQSLGARYAGERARSLFAPLTPQY